MPNKQPSYRIKDEPAVTEIYANKIVSAIFDGHVVSLTLGNGRIAPERADEQPKEEISIHVNCRIALSPSAALEVVNSINNIMATVQKMQKPAAAA